MAKYFIIAGEASGDKHAAGLIEQLKAHDPEAQFSGLGGDLMAAAGCRLHRHYREMAFMAFVDVLRNLGRVRRNFQAAKAALRQEQPDVLILIDYPTFNLRMAAYCRRQLPQTKVVYYIPPKVWAWKRWRVHRIARLCDLVLGIFPFEPDFYKRYGYRCEYVGNPTAEQVAEYKMSAISHQPSDIKHQPRIAILPGSRQSEVRHCLGTMLEAARRMPGYQIVVTAAPGLDDAFYAPYLREGEQLTRETYSAVQTARAAIVNSGTATLETALLGCPQVAVYHLAAARLLGAIRSWAQPLLFQIRYFTLVNILSGRETIRELVANDFTADKVAEELQRLLSDRAYTENMLADYEHIQSILGTQASAETAAKRIIHLITSRP